MEINTHSPSTQEAETEEWRVQVQPDLHGGYQASLSPIVRHCLNNNSKIRLGVSSVVECAHLVFVTTRG